MDKTVLTELPLFEMYPVPYIRDHQTACTSEDLYQLAYVQSDNSFFQTFDIQVSQISIAGPQTLIRLYACEGWSESLSGIYSRTSMARTSLGP